MTANAPTLPRIRAPSNRRTVGRGFPHVLAWGISLVVILPLLALLALALRGSGALWPHLIAYVLPAAALESALLLIGTAVLVIAIGTTTAWLVTAYEFPTRRLLAWALLLPLAMPAYIVAYAYLDLLHPIGPLQSALRAVLGIANPAGLRLPDFRSLGGGIFLFGMAFYPYVYLNVRGSFLMQSAEALEAARVLGSSGVRLFFRIALPMARPAIAAGAALALMEVLGDIGASEFLGIQTLTLSVYVTWATRGSVEGAAQIALAMLIPVAILFALEHAVRRRRLRAELVSRPLLRRRLLGWRAALATLACALPVLLGFAAPALHLLFAAQARMAEHGVPWQLAGLAWNSARFAAVATMLAIVAGFVLAFCQRTANASLPMRIVQIGYAIPGTVLAVGLLGMLAAIDTSIQFLGLDFLRGPLLMASAAALVLAYVARFLAVPVSALEAGYARLPKAMDDAARAVGAHPASIAWHIHAPLLRPMLRASALLLFIECMRELPATLLLRPLNTETLATFIYGEAARGTYEDGAAAALLMVLIGLAPVLLLAGRRPAGDAQHLPRLRRLAYADTGRLVKRRWPQFYKGTD